MIDCANGAAYKVAPAVLWELGAEVIAIGDTPNGFNINNECGSTFPEAMQRKVRERRADFGIALDGDADRVVMADEEGRLIDGDQILGLIARSWAKAGQITRRRRGRNRDVECGPRKLSQDHGSETGARAVGDRYVIEKMCKAASMSAASNRATSCSTISPPPATA